MKLFDIISPQCIKAPLTSDDKHAAINELVDCLASTGRVKNADQLKDAVWTREQTRTTGIGHGLAIPHGKSTGVDQLAVAIGKPAKPMEFQAIDGKPVRLIILLASPPDKTSDHIQALAHISKLMSMEDLRERVYNASSGEEIYEMLKAQEQPVG